MAESPLPSLIIPLQDRSLLLPACTLAEVTPMAGLIVESHSQRWVLGHKHWRNLRIPVVCFETLSGGSLKKHSEKACIAVFKSFAGNDKLPFWGMLVQGQPRTVKVSEKDICELDEHLSDTELMSVQLKNEHLRIPDLDSVEKQLFETAVAN